MTRPREPLLGRRHPRNWTEEQLVTERRATNNLRVDIRAAHSARAEQPLDRSACGQSQQQMLRANRGAAEHNRLILREQDPGATRPW
jgi:hypothetical protein